MDNPKAPDDTRDWDSINIFLFTNGVDSSPPRKYHLETQELKLWESTLDLLARSQFGNMQCNIEIYTLDGKKINTPLELINDAAYVAVKPPDSFIQTGYEKYLLKATRSWEKRHEKPDIETAKSERENTIHEHKEEIKSNLGANYDSKYDDDLALDTIKNENLAITKNNPLIQLQSDKENQKYIDTIKNSAKSDILSKKKFRNNTKNPILKKIYPHSKNKEEVPNLNKDKTTTFPGKLIKSNNNSKRIPISSNTTNVIKMNIEELKLNSKHKNNGMEAEENITATNEINESFKKDHPSNTPADMTDKNESEVQSMFPDADRKIIILNNDQRKVASLIENIEELGNDNCLNEDMTNSRQSASRFSDVQAPYNVKQPGTFNINLNLDLNGYTVYKTEEKSQANKFITYVTLMKSEKASQVNIDVTFNKEDLKLGNDVSLGENSTGLPTVMPCDEKFADSKTKVIVHCKCNRFESNIPTCNLNENDHYIVILPIDKNETCIPRNNLETTRQDLDKEIQDIFQSYIRIPVSFGSEIVCNKKKDNNIKHNVSIPQETPKKINFSSVQRQSQGDITQNTLTSNEYGAEVVYKIDNFAQTDWCNTLLQAKCQEDGRYTFHIPPLELLIQYKLL